LPTLCPLSSQSIILGYGLSVIFCSRSSASSCRGANSYFSAPVFFRSLGIRRSADSTQVDRCRSAQTTLAIWMWVSHIHHTILMAAMPAVTALNHSLSPPNCQYLGYQHTGLSIVNSPDYGSGSISASGGPKG
jgi:hypothetical protein